MVNLYDRLGNRGALGGTLFEHIEFFKPVEHAVDLIFGHSATGIPCIKSYTLRYDLESHFYISLFGKLNCAGHEIREDLRYPENNNPRPVS